MTCNHGKGGCGCAKIAWVLILVGALNWGLVGVGMLMGSDLNVVNMLLGSWPTVEAIVYLLVGISALVKCFGCSCKKCKEGCKDCVAQAPAGADMQGSKM